MASHRSGGFVDPGWEHGVAQDERKKKVRCNYCGKVVSGGIYRLKQHLARISGEVTYCDKAPDEVCFKMRDNLDGCRLGKKPRYARKLVELAAPPPSSSYLDFHGNHKGKNHVSDKGLVIDMTPPLRSLAYVDPGWEHGVPQDDRKKKVKCNYCDKVVSGGINRFKQHLAQIPGEVAPCKNAPEQVYLKIKENMKWHRTGRKNRRLHTSDAYLNSDNEDEENEEDEEQEEEEELASFNKTLVRGNRSARDVMFKGHPESLLKRPQFDSRSPKSQSSKQLKASPSKKYRKEVVSAMCKFFHHAGVSAHAANSPYFHKMLEVVGQYGLDILGPSTRILPARFLQDEISTIKNHLAEYRASWAVTGCSILADSWQDTQGRTLINILVSCPRGVYFVCSVDASNIIDDAASLFRLFDKVVEDMGEENVVQVITQNTPAYQAAGKMLEETRRNIFWTPCASHCIDQMLEQFSKIKWVGECLEKAQTITKFIYNRLWLLSLMKKEYTGGQEILRPSVTKSASSFTSLCTLLDHRVGLRRMFQSTEWHSSRYSQADDGKEVVKIVLSALFWKRIQQVKKSVDPVLEVLLKVNGDDSLSIPFIYNYMCKAKNEIKDSQVDDPRKHAALWNVIDINWNILCHHPLYLAAYFLNPAYRYRADFIPHPEVVRGLNACIVRLEPDSTKRISASMQISDFGSAKADFGTDLAISTRTELDPAAWWMQHGINCLELQRIAVRILSQTCSSYGCEHNWSMFDQIHRQKQNRIAQRRLNDTIYIHYNLRLRERQMRSKRCTESVGLDDGLDGVLDESLLYDWIVEKEKQPIVEDEEALYSDMEHVETQAENGYMEHVNNGLEYDDGNAELRKMEMVVAADIGDMNPAAQSCMGSDDEADMDFLDDNISE